MRIIDTLPKAGLICAPTVLSIGMFDGMHLGHQMVLEASCQKAQALKATRTLITFANHPSTILSPENVTPLVCTLEHRLHLLAAAGIDDLILLSFTRELAELSAEDFLRTVCAAMPIAFLILGSDATLGKNRAGDREAVNKLAPLLNFSATYLDDCRVGGARVSSSKIRALIRAGDLAAASQLLGRSYSIYAQVMRGHGRGKTLGFPTANLAVQQLCLPPLGVYSVTCRHQSTDYRAIANLGLAPTVRQTLTPVLEVHLIDSTLDLYGQDVEVIFNRYLRAEQHFDSLEALKSQIAKDIERALGTL